LTNKLKTYIAEPFLFEGRVSRTLLAIFILINGIVLFNAVFHDPSAGYDAWDHHNYIKALGHFRLPTIEDSHEFFSPPLPYVLPAAVLFSSYKLCTLLGVKYAYAPFLSFKFGQIQNVFVSVLLTLHLLKIASALRPGNISFRIYSLGFLGLLPVYYKMFSVIRGEPFVALFAVLSTYYILTVIFSEPQNIYTSGLVLGILLGLLILSRQWGFFFFPPILFLALIVAVKRQNRALPFIKMILLSLLIAAIVGGWFYLLHKVKYGSMTVHSKPVVVKSSFSNRPAKFYFGTGLPELFSNPVRPSFKGQFIPELYSGLWGDYLGYFVYTRFPFRSAFYHRLGNETGKNDLKTTAAYLGRVNAVSMVATALLFGGFLFGFRYLFRIFRNRFCDQYTINLGFILVLLNVVASFLGYQWYLHIRFVTGPPSWIKASYLLHMFPFVAILAADFMIAVKNKHNRLAWWLTVLLLITFVHNFQVMITGYSFLRFPELINYYNIP